MGRFMGKLMCLPLAWAFSVLSQYAIAGSVEEEVIVLGDTQIAEKALAPVVVLDRSAIADTGYADLADVIGQLPFMNGGGLTDRDPLSSALGGSAVSLRGLGANAVLILINGRRASSYGFSFQSNDALVSFVDLNSIPVAAVERVEILKDGASAMYGSEAIAGVINIVLRRDFEGFEVSSRYGGSDGGGAAERTLSGIWGVSSETADLTVMASFQDRDSLGWGNRRTTREANSSSLPVASEFLIGSNITQLGAQCEDRNASALTLDTDGRCIFNPNAQTEQPGSERWGINALADIRLSQQMHLEFEASFLNAQSEGQLEAPDFTGLILPGVNPWNPIGIDASASYRMIETGPRNFAVSSDNLRLLAQLRWEGESLSWEVGALHHDVEVEDVRFGELNALAVQSALNGVDLNSDGILSEDEYLNLITPGINPGNPDLLDTMTRVTQRRARSRMTSVFGKLAGEFTYLGKRVISYAAGFESLREKLHDRSDLLSIGSLFGASVSPDNFRGYRVDLPIGSFDPTLFVDVRDSPRFHPTSPTGAPTKSASRTRHGMYAEAQINLLPGLQVHGSARYDLFEGYDSEISPRLALSWQMLSKHLLRGSWGLGFRAPSLAELHEGTSTRVQYSWDPGVCPEPGFLIPTVAGCVAKDFITVFSGNKALEPEQSESFVVSVLSDWFGELLTTSVDCWQVDVEDRIIALGPDRILRYEEVFTAPLVERRPPDPAQQAAGIDGYADFLFNPYVNASRQKVRGCDLDVRSSWAFSENNMLKVQLLGSHMIDNDLELWSGVAEEDLTGTFGVPKNRVNLNVSLLSPNWRSSITARFIDGFDDQDGTGSVASTTVWNTRLSYAGLQNWDVALGIDNVMGRQPSGSSSRAGFTPEYFDLRGRFFYVQATVRLWGT